MRGIPPLRFLAITGLCWIAIQARTLADEKPPVAAIAQPDPSTRVRRPIPASGGGSVTESTTGWWLGPVIAVAGLAVLGGVSLASKRFLPTRESGPLQVVGRSSLSAKHSVSLLRVGDRVLIVGIGPQGPPSSLGEVTDPAELARLLPRRPAPLRPAPSTPIKITGFDRRIGDDE